MQVHIILYICSYVLASVSLEFVMQLVCTNLTAVAANVFTISVFFMQTETSIICMSGEPL